MDLLSTEEARAEGAAVLKDAQKHVDGLMQVLRTHTEQNNSDVEKLAHFLTAQIIIGACPDTIAMATNLFAAMLKLRDAEKELAELKNGENK